LPVAFTFRSWKTADPLLVALDLLRGVYAAGERKLPDHLPTAFLNPVWRKLVGSGAAIDRRAYEVAVMVALRDRLRAGDIWVDGSRAFRAFDDFLLPPAVFAARRQEGKLGLAVADRFEDWRAGRIAALESRLREVRDMAAADELPEAVITEAGLSISPIRRNDATISRGSTACCHACGSPSFSPRFTAGPGSPTGSYICAPEPCPKTAWR